LSLTAFVAFLALSGNIRAADATATSAAAAAPAGDASLFTKPNWLTDLSFADTQSFDDNLLNVSGLGLLSQSSWVNTASAKVGFDFAPLLADGAAVQTLSLVYQVDKATYFQDSQESYTAHRINDTFKGQVGDVSYSLVNAFLYNDGSKLADTYALNQLSGSAGNQNDKYRNNYAHAVPRERRNQDQDRYTATVQDNLGDFFFRPASSLLYYNLNTYQYNTSFAPYKGYQDYIDRWDVNGGADVGYRLTKDFAFTLGYRDGFQHQDQFALAINSDQHYSSNHYQRVLAGVEGKLTKWLTLTLDAGPDVRDFNPNTPITELHTTRFYGESTATATLPANQTLTFNFKQWVFVSSTGLVPYDDITYALTYHWSATKKLGLDLGAKYLEGNYTLGDDYAGSAPSLRDDLEYEGSVGVSYTIVPHLVASISDAYDKGLNGLATLAATYAPAYRNFEHQVVGLKLQYSF
jgi:hypothetical protein